MESKDLAIILNSQLKDSINPIKYKRILNRNNGLIRYDVINRILIEAQNNGAQELKTLNEWNLDGREIKRGAKPIYVIVPNYKSVYIDCNTGAEIDISDLSSDEVLKAIEYNIVTRSNYIDSLYSQPVYDVKQTYSTNNIKYKVLKPHLSIKSILKLFCDITSCAIVNCEETYYSKSENILFICKMHYKDLVESISKILAQYYIDNDIKELIGSAYDDSEDSLSEYDLDLILVSLTYAISSLLAVELDVSFDIVSHTSTNKIVQILNIVDSMMFSLISKLEFNKSQRVMDLASNVQMLKKAEILLNIMEANEIYKIMKGA